MIKELKTLKEVKSTLPLIKATMPSYVYEDAVIKLTDPGLHKDRTMFGYYNKSNHIVGCCGAYWDGRKYWISWTAILPDYQRQGIGQKLLNKVFDFVKRKMCCNLIYVETYEHLDFVKAINFYWKNGFTLCGCVEDHLKDGSSVLYLKRYL